jgi:Fur family zinc uptake transcriptional regulator
MRSACPHEQQSPPATAAQVERALEAAAARVTAGGGRLTRPRRRILELLLAAGAPVGAYDLMAHFHSGARVAKPATVYRALHFLETCGLVHRLSTLKAYVACDPDQPAAATTFLLCDCCGACRPIPSADAGPLEAAAAAAGYVIERITFEAQGRCAACRRPRAGPSQVGPPTDGAELVAAP